MICLSATVGESKKKSQCLIRKKLRIFKIFYDRKSVNMQTHSSNSPVDPRLPWWAKQNGTSALYFLTFSCVLSCHLSVHRYTFTARAWESVDKPAFMAPLNRQMQRVRSADKKRRQIIKTWGEIWVGIDWWANKTGHYEEKHCCYLFKRSRSVSRLHFLSSTNPMNHSVGYN